MQNNLILRILKNFYIKQGNSTAIQIKDKKVSYKKFFENCLDFANYININNHKIIGILGNYEYFNYVSLFGSLIGEKTYVPINENLPIDKIKKILKISKADLLSFSSNFKKKYKEIKIKKIHEKNFVKKKSFHTENKTNSHFAYIIFTSGSTGEPKGVPISRKNLNHYIKWLIKKFVIKKGNKCSQFPNIGFDLSVVDIFATICGGGTLVIPNNKFSRAYPSKFIKDNKITHAVFVPSFVDLMKNSNQLNKNYLNCLKEIFFCGEPLYKNQIKRLFNANKKLKIINAYGPTETTVSCTYILLNKKNFKKYCNDTVTIGKQINGMNLKLINNSKFSKKNGEILISGPQVFKEYLNRKDLNKKKFILINRKKFFRTGDWAKVINKNIYFVKRIDTQIKIKGYRVELNEIDSAIRKFGVSETKTIFKNNRLISFVVTRNYKKLFLVKKLKLVLPNYMIPSLIIPLKNFPKNINGKLDTKKLIKLIN